VFKGVMFDTYQWEQEMYDGTTATFEKLKRPDTVVIFPVLDNGKIILTRQEQPGKKPFVGAVGGRIDEGEDVLDAAKRELREESGYEADEFILWKAEHPTSKIDWVVFTFIAKGLKKVHEQDLDTGEKIKLMEVSLDELSDIALNPDFSEREVIPDLLESKINPNKREELENLFSSNI
jgi:ADP-ribose pyrophosphatase